MSHQVDRLGHAILGATVFCLSVWGASATSSGWAQFGLLCLAAVALLWGLFLGQLHFYVLGLIGLPFWLAFHGLYPRKPARVRRKAARSGRSAVGVRDVRYYISVGHCFEWWIDNDGDIVVEAKGTRRDWTGVCHDHPFAVGHTQALLTDNESAPEDWESLRSDPWFTKKGNR